MLAGLTSSSCDLDQAGWAAVTSAVRELEESWLAGRDSSFHRLLPEDAGRVRKAVLVELVKVDQEFRWERGDRRLVEDYLAEWPELADDNSLSELIQAECLTRAVIDGSVPTEDELRPRFPGVCQQIPLSAIEEQAARERRSDHDTQASVGIETTDEGQAGRIPVREWMDLPPDLAALETRYRLIAPLGQGGMGTVYRAFDLQLEREVALKVPREAITGNPEARARFLREARSAAAIKHPNICTIYDTGEVEGTCFITMELVHGPSLEDQIKAGRFTCIDAAKTVRPIARALAKIHAAKIIHRDIKPSNVMLEDGQPLLMDFGLARFRTGRQTQTKAGALVGTLPYMSPEQLNGTKANVATDIYSLGVVLYEMLTGRRPFRGSMLELIGEINSGNPPPTPTSLVPDVDPNLEAICLKAMSREPADRFSSADEFAQALDEYLQPLIEPAAETEKPAFSRRTRKAIAAAAGVFLLGLIVVLRTGNGTVQVEVDGTSTSVTVDGKPAVARDGKVAVPVGSHEIAIVRSDGKKHSRRISILWRSQTVAIPAHSIHGTVWNDRDGDGIRRRDEQPLPERLVWLDLDRDGLLAANEPQQTTDDRGQFHFTGLIPDRYIVRQATMEGWEQTTPGPLVYAQNFDTDPAWTTPHPDRYRWDQEAGDFVLTQRNVNHSKTEYAFHDIGYAIESFRLEYEILLTDVPWAAGANIGLFDTDLNANDDSCFVTLGFKRADAGIIADLNFFNTEGLAGSTQVWQNKPKAPSPPWIRLQTDVWYHAVLEYHAGQKSLSAQLRILQSGQLVGELAFPQAGSYAPEMTRLGSSNCRSGTFSKDDVEAAARIDNVKLIATSATPHIVELSPTNSESTVTFGNRSLVSVEGTVWWDNDRNGRQDDDEPGLPGLSVFADRNANGQFDAGEVRGLTDDSGNFRLAQLRPGVQVIALAVPESHDQTFPARHDWQQFQGQWYALTQMYGTWEVCEADARAAGGHLVTIDDAEENAWLARQYRQSFTVKRQDFGHGGTVWVGLHRKGERWVWSSGEPLRFHAGWRNAEAESGPGTDHVTLLTGGLNVWSNSRGSRPSIPGDYPRGIIELVPGDTPPEFTSHVVVLGNDSEKPVQLNFGIARSQP